MEKYLPFYKTYQTAIYEKTKNSDFLMWDDENCYRRDYEYMKSTYPETAKKMIPYVEEECERMEYSGSMIYDEYPDQLQLRLMCRRIYEKVKGELLPEEKDSGVWLKDLIWVVTWQEILKRRGEYRKYTKKFY